MEDRRFYVYCYYDKNDVPKYIGKGTGRRRFDHIRYAKNTKKNSHFLNWIRKYTQEYNENPKIEIIKNSLTNEESLNVEAKLIQEIGRFDLNDGTLLNSTDGGDGGTGRIVTEEEKRWRHDFSKSLWDDERKKKWSDELKGHITSEETKRKISIALTGRKLSDEHKIKLSRAQKGRTSWIKGKTHSDETKRKIGRASKLNWQRKEYREKININGDKNPNSKYEYIFCKDDNKYENVRDLVEFCTDKDLNPKSIRITFSNKKTNNILYKGWSIERKLK